MKLNPDKMAALDERWSDISPEEGTEDCVCSLCGKMIGTDERDPRWEDHDEDCGGCDVCEIAIRLFANISGDLLWNLKPAPRGLELRFHEKCFASMTLLQLTEPHRYPGREAV